LEQVEYTVVIPVYESVNTLEPLFQGINQVMIELRVNYEVIFVEDSGSEDGWKELLRLKYLNSDRIKIIRLSRNFGQNGATLCGIDQAQGKKVITIDDDLQTPPEEIKKLIEFQNINQTDVVYGIHTEERVSWIRRTGSRIVKRIFNRSQNGASVGSSFRLIDSQIVDKLRFHSQDHLFINQVIAWYTLDFATVEVKKSERTEGKSGYSLFKLILISLRLLFYYTSIPIKIMITMSIIGAIGILGMMIYYVFFQIGAGKHVDLFMITVLLAMSLISASIAVFGIYINRLYSARVKKPNYAIKLKM
jgi:glycosyltransferase involved in cell wall biosynthesis